MMMMIIIITTTIIIIIIMNQCFSGEEQVQRFCKYRNETLGPIKCGDFLH